VLFGSVFEREPTKKLARAFTLRQTELDAFRVGASIAEGFGWRML
jgi:hypothetical protein